ncbi:aldose epimerase family protein [Streptococcus caprae]|uniref:Aldose 1-epimerase n=1 Tax=Streptococcus caprae TaxID=1640501 RepID=A0ABV8CT66_9STRE
MEIKTRVIEVLDGQDYNQITLVNDHGVEASFLTLGATWQTFLVPDGKGGQKDLVLGFATPSDYLKSGMAAGQSVGRVAGRISQGHAEISGLSYQLPTNNNGNTLHGGPGGLHLQNWDFETLEAPDRVGVVFTYQARQELDGFPGDMTVTATYTLDNANQLTVTYKGAEATEDTLFNPTNHVYFNLSNGQDLATHRFTVAADAILAVDEFLIPSGQYCDVTDTPYDFRAGAPLVPAIEATGGIDDTFLVNSRADEPIAVLLDEASGDQVSIFSDRNALVVYSLNFPDDQAYFNRDHGKPGTKHEGVALEAQFPPDAINHPEFADIVLPKGQERTYTISYAYEKI